MTDILNVVGEPVYAFRRRGLDDFCTCTQDRYLELANKPKLFEVKRFYTADQLQAAYAKGREELIADGWRQCAVGQGETQFCGMLETEKAKAYRKGMEDMREKAAKLCDGHSADASFLYGDYAAGCENEAACCAAAIRALPIEGEQG